MKRKHWHCFGAPWFSDGASCGAFAKLFFDDRLSEPIVGGAVLVLAAGLMALAQPLQAQPEVTTAEQLRINTVRVQSTQNGFGFIVGERNGSLYIVTARHVLTGGDDSPDIGPPKPTNVTFYSDQGTPRRAEVLGTHEGDLAVLRVTSPANLQWVRSSVAGPEKQNRGTRVGFVGKRDEWYVPVATGTISSERPSTKSLIEVDGLSVSPGTSGAPLIASTGIVGMIQNDSAYDTRALTIDFIQRAILQWNYPWDLTAGRTSGPQTVTPVTLAAPPPSNPAPAEPAPVQQACSVDIDSEPSGASIRINGVSRGTTPKKISLTKGQNYSLSLDLDGYKAHTERIDCESRTVEATLEAQSGNIMIGYAGDWFACRLDLGIKIGTKTFRPTANPYSVRGIPLGDQNYTITGQIGCPNLGACVATGAGSINVQDGGLYSLSWANVALGGCRVALTGN
jgi:hypothetical protein